MERREEQYESKKTISIEEYLLKRQKKQEKSRYEKRKTEDNSSVHYWAELYI